MSSVKKFHIGLIAILLLFFAGIERIHAQSKAAAPSITIYQDPG